uniref:Ninjurin 1 n=1 Tax=Cyanoderma ruficeps TaxID=181631 RepID=A0A8C3XI53_9PASS
MDSGSETHELNGAAEGAESTAEVQRRSWQWFQRNRPININHYANKKSAAESMLDIALLMANASQLKAVMEQGPSFSFYVPLIILISLSLTLQIIVGVLLIFLGITTGHRPCEVQQTDLWQQSQGITWSSICAYRMARKSIHNSTF